METFSALLAICAGNSPVPDEFPTQRPVMRSFDVFLDLRLNKRLSKQSWGWWFEIAHYDVTVMDVIFKCIFSNENILISIKISMNFIPKRPINTIPALVQIMAWCRFRVLLIMKILWSCMLFKVGIAPKFIDCFFLSKHWCVFMACEIWNKMYKNEFTSRWVQRLFNITSSLYQYLYYIQVMKTFTLDTTILG